MAGKGSLSPPEITSFQDRVTGAKIYQITSHPSINHPSYFLQGSFFPHGRALIFISYRTGTAQLFEAKFPSGEIRQLTAGEPIHPFSPAIHPLSRELFFVRAGSVWMLDVITGREREVVNFPGAQLGECSLTSNGTWITAAIKDGSQHGLVVGKADGKEWSLIPFPRTVIHPQFHPTNPNWLIFSGDPAPRMHRVRRDGTGMECLYEHGNEEFVVHETFLGRTGDIVFTVWPYRLCRMNWETRQISTIADFNAWHIAPNRAGTKILCDTNHPDRGLYLIDAGTGEQRHICMSDSTNQGSQWTTSRYALAEDFAAARSAATTETLSWMETAGDTVYGPQWTHPHPSFSNDEKRVAFASDRTGNTQVYVVEI